MFRRNGLVFIIVLIIFFLAVLVVFPIEEGTLAKRGYGWAWTYRVGYISSIALTCLQ